MANEVDPAVWERKDRQIIRQNALHHATELVTHGCVKPDEDTNASVAALVCNLAEVFELWVYRTDKVDSNIPQSGPVSQPQQDLNTIVDQISSQLGLSYEVTKQRILDHFGRLPSNPASMNKIIEVIGA